MGPVSGRKRELFDEKSNVLTAPPKKRQLGDIYLDFGLVTPDQIETAMERQRQAKSHVSIGDVLVSLGFISEKDKIRGQAEQWGVPFMDLAEFQPDPDLIRLISQEMARRLKCLPIARTEDRLTLAMKNPLDIYAIDEVRLISGMDVEPIIASEEDIVAAIAQAYHSQNDVSDAVTVAIADLTEESEANIAFTDTGSETEEVNLDQLKALSPPMQRLGLMRAIRDNGNRCHKVQAVAQQQDYGNLAMWVALCDDGRHWAIFIAPTGDTQVRNCSDAERLHLPVCHPVAPPAEPIPNGQL